LSKTVRINILFFCGPLSFIQFLSDSAKEWVFALPLFGREMRIGMSMDIEREGRGEIEGDGTAD